MRKFVLSHLLLITLSGLVSSFCLVRLLGGSARPKSLFVVVAALSFVGLLGGLARVSRVLAGRTITCQVMRLSPGSLMSCELVIPTAVRHGRLLLFFEAGADALGGEISVFNKTGRAPTTESKHILTHTLRPGALPIRVPAWVPVTDRGVTYWLRSWRAGGDFRPVMIELPEPMSEGTILEMQLQVTKLAPGERQPKADDSKSLALVLKET